MCVNVVLNTFWKQGRYLIYTNFYQVRLYVPDEWGAGKHCSRPLNTMGSQEMPKG